MLCSVRFLINFAKFLFAIIINLAPPTEANQDPIVNKNEAQIRVYKMRGTMILDVKLKSDTYLPVMFLTTQKSRALSMITMRKQKVLSSIKMPKMR